MPAVDLGSQVEIMLEGLALSESSLRCSFTWAGDDYPCTGSPEKSGKRLDQGGYRVSSSLTIKARIIVFPSGIGIPKEGQTILYKRNASAEPVKYRIVGITNYYGAVLEMECDSPDKSA